MELYLIYIADCLCVLCEQRKAVLVLSASVVFFTTLLLFPSLYHDSMGVDFSHISHMLQVQNNMDPFLLFFCLTFLYSTAPA